MTESNTQQPDVQPQPQQTYAQPPVGAAPQPGDVNNYVPVGDMTIGKWIVTYILTAIPIVGFVMLIVWAVSSSPEDRVRKTWAQAMLIIMAISVALSILLGVVLGGSLLSLLLMNA